MSFDYKKGKNTHAGDSFWTSYSDLFLGLSTIFLLLYVMASLRNGTDALKAQVDGQKLTMQNDQLRSQLKMYEQIKADYLEKEASKSEVNEYEELMDKLTLLKEEAKTDQERLAREALENEHKGQALNKYQQLVRNIINANKVAKTKLITRNDVINEQDETIDTQQTDIETLNNEVEQKKDQIHQSEQKIAAAKSEIQHNKNALKKALEDNKITESQYNARLHKMQTQGESKIKSLQAVNQSANQQLNKLSAQLQGTTTALQAKEKEAEALQGEAQNLRGETESLRGETSNLKSQVAAIKSKYDADKAASRAALDAEMKKGKMDAAARAAREKSFRAEADRKEREMQGQIAGLSGEAQSLRGEAESLRGEASGLKGQVAAIKAKYESDKAAGRAALDAEMKKGKMDAAARAAREGAFRAEADRKEREMQGRIAGLSGKLASTQGELSKAKEEMDARREIAREIKKGFAAAGIKADVNMGTGEVVLDFGDHYFESNSADLKPEMKDIIERAMPVYSRSLFGNSKVANKISSVEVVGFASPTYHGRFVNPKSSKPEDKAALKYNMDLSYRRANSIFNYLVESKDGEFDHQKDLMSLMKVSGRSFLEVMKVQGRAPASAAEFCKVNDCKKAQKVIVRFSMDGKN